MIMSFAALHLPEGNWDKCTVFMVLRAFHYLYDFHGIREVYLNIASVPENAAKVWETSLGRKKKGIRLLCNMPCAGLPLFAEPDFPLFIDGKQRVDLMIPEIPGLTDFHVHTPLAFCRENMTVPETMEMARCNRIAKVNFSEHSGQLFCSADTEKPVFLLPECRVFHTGLSSVTGLPSHVLLQRLCCPLLIRLCRSLQFCFPDKK